MTCDACGMEIEVGSWPWCPHGRPTPSKGFEPYFDYGLGIHVSTPGDRNKAMRPKWNNDYIEHLQPRDKAASYYKEMAERREARRHGR